MDPIDSYKEEIALRFQDLPEEEKEVLKTLPDSPFASPLSKLFGPEMADVFADFYPQEVIPETPEPQISVEQQMQSSGLTTQ